MEPDENIPFPPSFVNFNDEEQSPFAVNSLVLDYYKKFGRKRDLEQYFSLSTAQGDIRDPSGLFWRRMKTQYDSDSGEKKSESSTELCRISIKCSIPDQSSGSQDGIKQSKPVSNADSESPPIVTEEKSPNTHKLGNSDDDSQKSLDQILDTSANKLPSPTSSINSQRKLEWDSLADVGYANEGDRKTSSPSLSTLERLALQQQYSNNENIKPDIDIGVPTAQSTPIEVSQPTKSKSDKKSLIKSTKYYNKDVDYVQVSVPQEIESSRPINVNLTKHISFNVGDKNNVMPQTSKKEEVFISPKMISVETAVTPEALDKEIQTSLSRRRDNKTDNKTSRTSINRSKFSKAVKVPVVISLNTLRQRSRNRKIKSARKKTYSKLKTNEFDKHDYPQQEKNGDPISEAESFEYMPGHIYNQNKSDQNRSKNSAGNKSSLESSSGRTTESSKDTNISFTKDLEKSLDELKRIVDQRQKNANYKNYIVKEIVKKLVRSKYRDDDNTGLGYSKVLNVGQGDYTTTSTSDQNNTLEKDKPRKSILRRERNVSSVPQNISNVSDLPGKNVVNPNLVQKQYSSSELEDSSNKHSSVSVRTSSEELYIKYIEALKKERDYKRYLKEKELFLKQKLAGSSKHTKQPVTNKINPNRLNELVKDLATNKYDDGSGDASKLQGNTDNVIGTDNLNMELKAHRSHSVYTLSSGNSVKASCSHENKKLFSPQMSEKNNKDTCSKCKNDEENRHCYCCLAHSLKTRNVTDSSVQVNLVSKPEQKTCSVSTDQQSNDLPKILPSHFIPEKMAGELKYVCFCTKTDSVHKVMPDNLLIYKCSCLTKCAEASDNVEPLGIHQNDKMVDNKNDYCCTTDTKFKDTVHVNKLSETSLANDAIHTHYNMEESKIIEPEYEKDHQIKDCDKCKITTQTCYTEAKPSRYIQTDLSIYPKISDPTLSDILTVNETSRGRDCGVGIGQTLKTTKRVTETAPCSDADSRLVEIFSSKSELSVSSGIANEGGWCAPPSCETNKSRFKKAVTKILTKKLKETKISDLGTGNGKPEKNDQGVNTEPLICCDKEISLHECTKIVQNSDHENSDHSNDKDRTKHNSAEQLNQNKPQKNGEHDLDDQTFGEYDKTDSKFDRNNNGDRNISHGMPTSKKYNKDSIAKKKSTEIPDYIQKLTKYHTYPPSQSEEQKCISNSYKKEQVIGNAEQSNDMSKKLACLRKLNKVDSKECDIGHLSTVQTIKTKEIYSSNHCRKDIMGKPKSNGDSEDLNELIFQRYQCETVKSGNTSNGMTSKSSNESAGSTKDPIMALIKDITKRYSKRELEKSNRKKCFKEIMFILNYLLDTDETTDTDNLKRSPSATTSDHISKVSDETKSTSRSHHKKILVDRATQFYNERESSKESNTKFHPEDSSDVPFSSDIAETSNETPAFEVLNRIKKECEKYQKRCKATRNRNIEASSSTSVHYEQPKKDQDNKKCVHKCKNHSRHSKQGDNKMKKKSIAYNLIIQTSDSMLQEETVYDKHHKPLQNIIVKVPSKRLFSKRLKNEKEPQEMKVANEKVKQCRDQEEKHERRHSKDLSDNKEVSDSPCHDDATITVSEYLERNRPDFLQKSLKRQDCLKVIKETRARQRDAERELLAELETEAPEVAAQLRAFEGRLPLGTQERLAAPKFVSERDMKKHSEKIYKTLPEVTRKKEELRKERIKRTNLIMAHLFNKMGKRKPVYRKQSKKILIKCARQIKLQRICRKELSKAW